MTSIAPGYGPPRRMRNAAAALGLLLLMGLLTGRAPAAAPLRLLVLGDSLAAGYGLARPTDSRHGLPPRCAARASP